MLEHINTINVLSDQIKALLDLMQMSDDSVYHSSIKTASEMCMTMHEDLMAEVEQIEQEWRQQDNDIK